MTWLQHFITEDIYVFPKHEKEANLKNKLGIIIKETLDENEKELLQKIIAAVHFEEKDCVFETKISNEIKYWLIFENSYEYSNVHFHELEHKEIENMSIICVTPFQNLLNDLANKKKLWQLLKTHFLKN